MAYNEKARATNALKNAEKVAARAAEALKVARANASSWSIAAPVTEVTTTHAETGMSTTKTVKPQVVVEDLPDPELPPFDMFNGRMLKLAVHPKEGGDPNDPIPGFQLYWFNDEKGYINAAQKSGWRLVEKDEIAELNDAVVSAGNSDLTNNVRKLVGHANGQPLFAFLMKKSNELYDYHMRLREQHNARQEQLVRGGQVSQKDPEHTYARNNIRVDSGIYR